MYHRAPGNLHTNLGVVGPEYISMVSAEAKRPRIYIKSAFKTVYIRLAIFFVGGSLCAGIVVAYNVSAELLGHVYDLPPDSVSLLTILRILRLLA